MQRINQLFDAMKIRAEVVAVTEGLRTREYCVSLKLGEKVSKIRSIGEELALAVRSLSAPEIKLDSRSGHVIIETTTTDEPITIPLADLISTMDLSKYILPLVLGKDMHGHTTTIDLADCPHLLIGGTTGAGKSVLSKSILCSLAAKHSADDLKFILLDPKGTELTEFASSDYCQKYTRDYGGATATLSRLVDVMESRYDAMSKVGCSNWSQYKQGRTDEPYIVVLIDELVDLLLQDKDKSMYIALTRLLQKARAAGIHIVSNTQRPSAKVVDGVLKANMGTQIALRTTSNYDSRIIIGRDGAEKLVGKGDMLVHHGGKLVRVQGAIA